MYFFVFFYGMGEYLRKIDVLGLGYTYFLTRMMRNWFKKTVSLGTSVLTHIRKIKGCNILRITLFHI